MEEKEKMEERKKRALKIAEKFPTEIFMLEKAEFLTMMTFFMETYVKVYELPISEAIRMFDVCRQAMEDRYGDCKVS